MHRFTHALAALVLAAPAAAAFAGDTNAFSNPTAGFALTKPAGWHYLSAAQNMDNIKRMKLSDEEFHAMMKQYASAPLVAMSKYQEPFDDVNPSFKVNLRPYGQLKGIPATELIKLILPQFQKTFKDFALVQAFLADYLGNLVYALTARNFNPVIALAGGTVIAEVEQIVPVGMISPDHVVTPAVLVDYLVGRA